MLWLCVKAPPYQCATLGVKMSIAIPTIAPCKLSAAAVTATIITVIVLIIFMIIKA